MLLLSSSKTLLTQKFFSVPNETLQVLVTRVFGEAYKSYITNSWKYVLKKADKKEKKKNGSYKAFFITRKCKKDN